MKIIACVRLVYREQEGGLFKDDKYNQFDCWKEIKFPLEFLAILTIQSPVWQTSRNNAILKLDVGGQEIEFVVNGAAWSEAEKDVLQIYLDVHKSSSKPSIDQFKKNWGWKEVKS